MRRVLFLGSALLAGCTPNFDKFAAICRENGRVIVHDRAVWNAYLEKLRAETRKYSSQEASSEYLVLYPTPGFDFPSDFSRHRANVKRGTYRNNFYVAKDGRDAATIVNYVLSWTGPDSAQSADCVHNHPEVYGVKAFDVGVRAK